MNDAVGGPLAGGASPIGDVVRVGDTVRRRRGPGAAVVESLLLHLADRGFDRSPRFLGIDDDGCQILEFVDGDVYRQPPWQLDDDANAAALGRLAATLCDLHEATSTFVAPADTTSSRPLPLAGSVWTHGDPGYGNVVYCDNEIRALIDWEFAAPADPLVDPAGLIALSIRGPRPDADDPERRARAAHLALHAVADGYAMSDDDRVRLPDIAALVVDDAVAYWAQSTPERADLAAHRWRATWFRDHTDWLLTPFS